MHSVTVTDGVPKLVIACYAQGQTQRSFLSVWRTVTVKQSRLSFAVNLEERVIFMLFGHSYHSDIPDRLEPSLAVVI